MSKIYTSAEQLIGRTPLMQLTKMEKAHGLFGRLLAKLECFNPGGSAKDRAARAMLDAAEADGRLRHGSVIIEPTSGNTGIGLAMVAVPRGYRTIIVMPETMSMERRTLMKAYGAELVLTDGELGMAGSIERAKQLADSIPGSFLPDQFENPDNPRAHYETTGPEIYEDAGGEIDLLVAGVGTGGTITGAGRYLKERIPGLRVVAVEPAGSPVLSGGEAGPHGLQGIGAGFVPGALDREIMDEVITVTDQQAYDAARELGRREGLLVGISSGAALYAAMQLLKRPENSGKTAAVVLPDTGERYLSTPLFKM